MTPIDALYHQAKRRPRQTASSPAMMSGPIAGWRKRASVLRDILASSRTQLADYKVPERLKVVDELPRNTLGKIDRRSAVSILLDDETDDAVAAE